MSRIGRIAAATIALLIVLVVTAQAQRKGPKAHRREVRNKIGGVPEKILKLQSTETVKLPTIEAAVAIALKAAEEAARPLIDTKFHKGRRLTVPDDFNTIQGAMDAANSGDIVVVKAGTYFELIVMKDGVKLISDSSGGGDELVAVEGARMKLPRRTLRTIIDGSKSETSRHGMFDFNPGLGRKSIVDGFTIQNLPKQDHHIPGHAHGLNVRGASPVIMNCYVLNNGSTGIGNHVVFEDQGSPMPQRDFRWANVKHKAEGVIYNNIIRENLGLGIGCNHFSAPHILGNEVFLNTDVELGHEPSPGMGAKHGAAPIIIGNIVHDNIGGGIQCGVGEPQGKYQIDRPTHPTVMKNVVYRSGTKRPAISSGGGGSKQLPVRFVGNFVFETGYAGIALQKKAFGIIENNTVSGTAAPGIAINGATALKLNHNKVKGAAGPGFMIKDGAEVIEMVGNAADCNQGPRFMLRGATIAGQSR